MRGDKECPFSGVTISGRVWTKVPESDAWRVPVTTLLSYVSVAVLFVNVCLLTALRGSFLVVRLRE